MASWSWVGVVSGDLGERGNFLTGSTFAVQSIVKSGVGGAGQFVVTGNASGLAGQTITLYGTTASDGDYTVTTAVYTTTTLLTVTSNTGLTDQAGAAGAVFQSGLPATTDGLTILATLPAGLGSTAVPHNPSTGSYSAYGGAVALGGSTVAGGDWTHSLGSHSMLFQCGDGSSASPVTISGGTFAAGAGHLTIEASGSATGPFAISGGTFSGCNVYFSFANGGSMISGGTFAACSIITSSFGDTISGGAFDATCNIILYINSNAGNGDTISGGTFATGCSIQINGGLDAVISGGTFGNVTIKLPVNFAGANLNAATIETDDGTPIPLYLSGQAVQSIGPWPADSVSVGPFPIGSTSLGPMPVM